MSTITINIDRLVDRIDINGVPSDPKISDMIFKAFEDALKGSELLKDEKEVESKPKTLWTLHELEKEESSLKEELDTLYIRKAVYNDPNVDKEGARVCDLLNQNKEKQKTFYSTKNIIDKTNPLYHRIQIYIRGKRVLNVISINIDTFEIVLNGGSLHLEGEIILLPHIKIETTIKVDYAEIRII